MKLLLAVVLTAFIAIPLLSYIAQATSFGAWLIEEHVVIALISYFATLGLTFAVCAYITGGADLIIEIVTRLQRWFNQPQRPSTTK